MRLFLDESGNTGDAATLEWPDQPTFVLAAVGQSESGEGIGGHLSRLRDEYHIQMPELKGSKLFETKDQFIEELVTWLINEGHPIFVEVMDKKYFVTTLLVSYFLSTPEEAIRDINEVRDCNIIANIIYQQFSSSVVRSYGKACIKRTPRAVYRFMADFVMEIRDQVRNAKPLGGWESAADAAQWANLSDISQRGYTSTKAFEQMRDDGLGDQHLVEPFLPPAETNKRGSVVAMLPHYSAFGNMYARINAQYRDEEFELIHDEQDHFDHILSDLQRSMKSNQYAFISEMHEQAGMPWSGTTSLDFGPNQTIRFSDSKNEVGIQVADVVAGFCRKYFDRCALKNDRDLSDGTERTAEMLREMSRGPESTGVNVLSSLENQLATFVTDRSSDKSRNSNQ
jgi:hypothetical protein